MEFTIEAGELSRIIGYVRGIVPSRTTIPILNNVRVSCNGGSLSITATNLCVEATAVAVCAVVTAGEITIPGHTLFGIAKALPKTKLMTVKIDDYRAIVTSGKSRYSLHTFPADDFPLMPQVEDDANHIRVSMPVSDLRISLDATRSAAGDEPTRMYLNGVHVCIEGNSLAFVTTDGHRLIRRLGSLPHGIENLTPAIIPNEVVREIASMMAVSEGDASVAISNSKISVAANGNTLIAKLIEGTYPDYMRVIPRSSHASLAVNAGVMSEAIDRLSVVYSGTDTKAPVATCTAKGKTIELTAGSSTSGFGSETIDAEVFESCEFSASAKYLSEMLKLWPSTATLEITSASLGSPILIVSKDEPSITHVLMPMKRPAEKRFAEAAE